MITVTIFGSGKCQPGTKEYEEAFSLGALLGKAGLNIANGGYSGTMEAVLKGAATCSTIRTGITMPNNSGREPNKFVNNEIKTNNYLDRLSELIKIGDAYIILDGGSGTLLEFAALLALSERKMLENKPIICLSSRWKEICNILDFEINNEEIKNLNIKFVNRVEEAVEIIKEYFDGTDF